MYTRLTSVHIITVSNRCGKCVPNFTPLRLLSRTRSSLLTYVPRTMYRYTILYTPIGCLAITTSTTAVWLQLANGRR